MMQRKLSGSKIISQLDLNQHILRMGRGSTSLSRRKQNIAPMLQQCRYIKSQIENICLEKPIRRDINQIHEISKSLISTTTRRSGFTRQIHHQRRPTQNQKYQLYINFQMGSPMMRKPGKIMKNWERKQLVEEIDRKVKDRVKYFM